MNLYAISFFYNGHWSTVSFDGLDMRVFVDINRARTYLKDEIIPLAAKLAADKNSGFSGQAQAILDTGCIRPVKVTVL